MKVVIIGNVGSGKKAMAEQLIGTGDIALLSLDDFHDSCKQTGHSLEEGLRLLRNVLDSHTDWVVESCNGDLVEIAIPYCEELRFMNPGVEECAKRYMREIGFHEGAQEMNEVDTKAAGKILRAGSYEQREDAYGLMFHRKIFDNFAGPKMECTAVI